MTACTSETSISRLNPILRRLRGRLLAEQRGFTIIELMIAASLMAGGMLAVVGTLDRSRKLVSESERKESATHVAEQALEQILALPDASIAMNPAPMGSSHVADPNHACFHVTSTSPAQYRWDPGGPGAPEHFAFAPSGVMSSGCPGPNLGLPWTWSDGRLGGEIFRFVTCADDPITAPTSAPAGCPSGYDYKRVTVAVSVNGEGGPRKPVLLSSIVVP